MSRRRWLVLAAVAAALVVGGLLIALRDRSTPIDRADVAASFEGRTGYVPGDPGIYSYTTTGFEEVDALGGARHDYPSTTFMVIEEGECGPVVRWQPLRERSVSWSHCGPDLAVTSTVEVHRWFGVEDVEVETCPSPRPVFWPAASVRCEAEDTAETYTVEVLGVETIVIGGSEVKATHTRRASEVSGGSTGRTVAEVWRMPGTPLILRLELEANSVTSTALGEVSYAERVVLVLDGLRPSS